MLGGDVRGSGTFELSTASSDSSFVASKTDSISVFLSLDDGLSVLVQLVLPILLLLTLVHVALPA